MKELRCCIVDDDPVSREVLRKCIADDARLKLVGTYHNATEAKMGLIKKEIDLVFLDVEMPDMTGFELLDSYKDVPQVVMVTSEKKYAFEAFEYDITDFLSKPVNGERFRKAVERVRFYSENLKTDEKEAHHIVIKSNGVLVRMNAREVDYIEAMGDYIKMVVGDQQHIVHSTMKAFIAELPDSFLRVHKSYIVNLDKVLEMDDAFLIGEHFNLPVSRSYKKDVKDKFKEWM